MKVVLQTSTFEMNLMKSKNAFQKGYRKIYLVSGLFHSSDDMSKIKIPSDSLPTGNRADGPGRG
jgi:hypothetical protein